MSYHRLHSVFCLSVSLVSTTFNSKNTKLCRQLDIDKKAVDVMRNSQSRRILKMKRLKKPTNNVMITRDFFAV